VPKFLEDKLKKQYGSKSNVPYKIMNSIGAMRGSKTTPKGHEMERRHELGLGGKVHSPEMYKKKKKKSFAQSLRGAREV
jgi:hypothetical protein